ncbi:MAG: (cytosine-5)-methyltransferase 1 [Patescibacteria group bacterium]|nr:DNA cytosine methyltransferase [Candidatus Saccharibacteria bacterium]MDQ5963253.1 (cytosine-5)-methyltransferase 1 [Patescibacteria group bacterium]
MSFKFVDLFAGTGGIRIPFDEIGGECVLSSEWDKSAQITYQANFGEAPLGDITAINENDVPKHNIIMAGFPCQPFSHAGLKKGFNDTRGTLFFDIARIIKKHKPEIVFLENVKGFKGHDRGRTFETIKNVLDELGYNVSAQVLSAKDFGVPQNRQRFYMIGLKRSKYGKDTFFEFPTAPKIPTRVGDILEKKVDPKYTISDKLWAGHQRRRKEHAEKGNGFGYGLFDEDSAYTNTISARYYKDGSEVLIKQKGKNPRKLTPREAARLQGYPESFKIVVSDTQAYRQFGNAVAVPVIREIVGQLKPFIGKI